LSPWVFIDSNTRYDSLNLSYPLIDQLNRNHNHEGLGWHAHCLREGISFVDALEDVTLVKTSSEMVQLTVKIYPSVIQVFPRPTTSLPTHPRRLDALISRMAFIATCCHGLSTQLRGIPGILGMFSTPPGVPKGCLGANHCLAE